MTHHDHSHTHSHAHSDEPHAHSHSDASSAHAHSHSHNDEPHAHGGAPHAHHHHHHDHSHAQPLTSLNTIYVVAVLLNLLFVVVEAVAGWIGHSLGLLSDAGHNLSDVFSLLLAMVALKLSHSAATKRFTYGRRKASVLISLLNAIILLVAVGMIILESVEKFMHPVEVNSTLIIWTAGIGILINGLTAYALARSNQHDINTRGAFLHMLADTLVSVGVVVSGVVIRYTGWWVVDPIIGLVVAVVILISTWSLLTESLRMSSDAVPEGFDVDDIAQHLAADPDVEGVHHLHIWPISTSETALTAHVVVADPTQLDTIRMRLKAQLAALGIQHSTLEFETIHCTCPEQHCHA